MGSLRAKQASYIEIVKAIQAGALQPLTRDDLVWAEAFIHNYSMFTTAEVQAWLKRRYCDSACELFLPFDETSGQSAFDLSGNGNTGTATGTTIVDGVFGKARSFNGSSDFVDCGSGASLDILSKFTFEAWIKRGADKNSYIFDQRVSGVIHGYLAGIYQADNLVAFMVEGGSGGLKVKSSSVIPLDEWKYIGLVNNNKAVSIYIDGKLDNTGAFSENPSTGTKDTQIGRYFGAGDYWFQGLIDEPRIYSRALSADEMYLHYLAGALKLGLI